LHLPPPGWPGLRGSSGALLPRPCPSHGFERSAKGTVCQYSFPRPSVSNTSAQCKGSSIAPFAKSSCWQSPMISRSLSKPNTVIPTFVRIRNCRGGSKNWFVRRHNCHRCVRVLAGEIYCVLGPRKSSHATGPPWDGK